MAHMSTVFFEESREYLHDIVQQGASIGLVEISTGYSNSPSKRYRCLFIANNVIKDLTYTVGVALDLDWDKKFEAIITAPFRSDGAVFIQEEILRKLGVDALVYEV